MQRFTLESKTILITGASSGIGRATAIACAESGASCILVARNEDRLNEVAVKCGGTCKHRVEVLDVCDTAAMAMLVARLPQIDGVVQCAGVGDKHTPLKFLSADFVTKVVDINMKAPILFLAMLDKSKKLKKGASVVLMSSISSFSAAPAHSLYMATKGGLTAFAKGAALDLAQKKIRVNTIAPGMVNTPMINYSCIDDEQTKADVLRYPMRRYGEPEDIAGLAVYLMSDASSWVTGQQFVIDGGFTAGR